MIQLEKVPVFVEASWLLQHRQDPRIRIVDARSASHSSPGCPAGTGAQQYAAGHIAGAVQLDYADQLKDPATPYAIRVAPPELFAYHLGMNGIGEETTIIAYDAGRTPYAARIVWMCRYYGHDDAHILAGGLQAWIDAGGEVTTDLPEWLPKTFTPRVRPELRATRDEVVAASDRRSTAQVLETQRDASYGQRDGAIPHARRLSASLLLEDARGGRIAPRAVLKRLLDKERLDRRTRTIVSCGSGVSASGAYLALLEAGFTDVAVYDGSWMEWSHWALPSVPNNHQFARR